MYKQLLNTGLYFNISGDLQNGISSDYYSICLDGKYYSFHRTWVGFISHYEVLLPVKDLLKINFVPIHSRVLKNRSGVLMVFKRPIQLNSEFRIIPGYTKFGISRDGRVKSTITGKTLKQWIGPYGYPCTSIYDADKNKWRTISVHILIARAYVENKFPSENIFVNHIDGDKLNFNISNLEWTTSSNNNRHAVINGLRNDNQCTEVLDVKTNVITRHESISAACKFIGLAGNKPVYKNKDTPSLFFNRYEIKRVSDKRDWFYNNANLIYKSSGAGIKLEIKRVSDGQVFIYNSISELSSFLNVTTDVIRNILRYEIPTLFDGYLIRAKDNKDWSSEYRVYDSCKIRQFILSHIENGREITFRSLRQAVMFLNCDKRTFKNKLLRKIPIDNWLIQEITV